jgi:hypothetical protein
VLASYGSRIRWLSEPDSGPCAAIEKGLAMTRAPFVTWLNDDDLWLPGAVRRAVAVFADESCPDVVYGACAGVDGRGRLVWWEPARPWSLEAALIEVDHVINQPSSFIRRDALERAGGLRHDWIHDQDLWVRVGLDGGRFEPIGGTLAATRIHDANRSLEPRFALEQRIAFVDRWLADERVPHHLKRREAEARSNAYLRGLHFLHPGRAHDWRLGATCITNALRARPGNAATVGMRPLSLAWTRTQRARRVRDFRASEPGGAAYLDTIRTPHGPVAPGS